MCAVIPTRRRNQPRTVPSHMDQCIISRTHRHIKPRTSTGILPYLVRTRVLGYHTAKKVSKAAQYGNLNTLKINSNGIGIRVLMQPKGASLLPLMVSKQWM